MKNKRGKRGKAQLEKTCSNCGNCQYIGDGDYACIASETEPVIVMEEHTPNENYCYCNGKEWEAN